MGKHVSGAGRKVIAARGSLPMVALDSLPVIASVTASQASVARRNADFKQNMYSYYCELVDSGATWVA